MQPTNPDWLLGKIWGIRHWEPGKDRGNLIMIKKEHAPLDPEIVGPNQGLGELEEIDNINKTQQVGNITITPQSENPTDVKTALEYSALWKVMQASYGIINKTNPELTKECWLCYNIRPPFYEGIGVTAKARRINGTNPAQCL